MVATCWGHACKPPLTPECSLLTLYRWRFNPETLRFPCQMLKISWGFHAFVVMVLVQTTAWFVPKALTTFDILRALFGCEDLTGHIQSKIEKITCLYGFSNEISVWALYFSQLHQVMHAMIMTVMGLEPAWKEMEASEPCDYVSL